jgi:16S rRNA (guanine1207-N2)-methyltransferase
MPAPHDDPALQTLLLPIADGTLSWPEAGALFLRARDGWPLHERPLPGLACEQSFKPDADALQRSGFAVRATAEDDTWPLILLLPPRQRDEARALFAHALARLQPGGSIVAAASNDAGAKSAEADLARVAGPLVSRSKHKCRVFWTQPGTGTGDAELAAQWRALDAPRPIVGGRYTSRPGVFAWDRVDPASALLAEHLPADLHGRAADLGAGYGYLSIELLQRCAGITALDLYEAEGRALELARTNLAPFAQRLVPEFRWHDVTAGLPERYDVIVSNPPFHAQGSAERPDIGRRFIAVAAEALRPGGRLWLVANRHLPYESVLDASFGSTRLVAQRDGFKVVEAIKSAATPVRTGRASR